MNKNKNNKQQQEQEQELTSTEAHLNDHPKACGHGWLRNLMQ